MEDHPGDRAPEGYLNVLKPPGMTSHDVVARVRRITRERRVGHAGTLDPSAAGVLPVAVGRRATRTISSPVWDVKSYAADVLFGVSTTTDDAEGIPLAHGDPSGLGLPAIELALGQFVGVIEQRPPAYSAVHVEGVRSYQRARRGASDALPPRRVQVDGIRLLGWASSRLSLLIQCRSGTYIRSIARDLGEALGCPAHLGALLRLRVGPFRLEEAVTPKQLRSIAENGAWKNVLWPIDVVAWSEPALVVEAERRVDFDHGRGWLASTATVEGTTVRVYDPAGELLGFAAFEGGRWNPMRAPGLVG